MPSIIKFDNFPASNVKEKTYLDEASLAGVTSLTVRSTQGIGADDIGYVGYQGDEQTEKFTVPNPATGLDETSLPLSGATDYPHAALADVVVVRGDQGKIYRAPAVGNAQPADNAFVELATIDLDPDNLETLYEDAGGSTAFWYKVTYVNSETDAETPLSDSLAYRGDNFAAYSTVSAIRIEAGLQDATRVPDSTIVNRRREVDDIINSALVDDYGVPFEAPIPPQISLISTLMTAGYLMNNEYAYSPSAEFGPGDPKIREGKELLEKIRTHEATLVDESGESILPASSSDVDGWPNNTTAEALPEDAGGARRHRITDEF